jgi:hypothetical protein
MQQKMGDIAYRHAYITMCAILLGLLAFGAVPVVRDYPVVSQNLLVALLTVAIITTDVVLSPREFRDGVRQLGSDLADFVFLIIGLAISSFEDELPVSLGLLGFSEMVVMLAIGEHILPVWSIVVPMIIWPVGPVVTCGSITAVVAGSILALKINLPVE